MTKRILSPQVGSLPLKRIGNSVHRWQQFQENFIKNVFDAKFKEQFQDASKQPAKTPTTRAKNKLTRFNRVQPLDDQCAQESNDENLVSQGIHDIVLKKSPNG